MRPRSTFRFSFQRLPHTLTATVALLALFACTIWESAWAADSHSAVVPRAATPSAANPGSRNPVASKPVPQTHSEDVVLPQRPEQAARAPSRADADQMLHRQAPVFIENRGQFDPQVKFLVKGNGGSLWLTNEGIVFDFQRPTSKQSAKVAEEKPASLKPLPPGRESFDPRVKSEQPPMERLVFKQKLVSSNPNPTIEARDPQPGIYNYFSGSDPDKWRTHVLAYKEVVYRDVWNGIDLKLFSNGQNLEEEFIVHPGADPNEVQLSYEGINGLDVADDGSLQIRTAFGVMTETKPSIYQDLAGQRAPLSGSFKVSGSATYAFSLASHRTDSDLIIDPTLLYSTFLGGSNGDDWATGIAVDASGSAYVAGTTGSTDFPITPGAFQTVGNGHCSFITKFFPLGNGLQYSTYLCAYLSDASISGIGLDAAGDAYVTGSSGTGFPTTSNAFQQSVDGIFVTVLSSKGDSLLYSSGFGHSSTSYAIAVDAKGRAYFTGTSASTCCCYGSIPTTSNAFQSSYAGCRAAFLGVLDPSQSGQASLVYGSYLGGSIPVGGQALVTHGQGIAVDAYNMAYVGGFTTSLDFPVTPGAFQVTFGGGGYDGFLAKFNPYASSGPASVLYSTYIGGGGNDGVYAVAVDSRGDAFIGGVTNSGSLLTLPPFPTTPGALLPNWNDGWVDGSGFVTEMNAAGSHLVSSTYWGGVNAWVYGLATDIFGNAYAVGITRGGLIVSGDAFQSTYGGSGRLPGDAYVSKFDTQGGLIYSSYLGGLDGDAANGVAVDAIGDAYVTGYTASLNFPVTPGAFQTTIADRQDAFVTKFPLGAPGNLSVLGIFPSPSTNNGVVLAQIVGTGFRDGATARLVHAGEPDIVGDPIGVGTGGQTILAAFDLHGVDPGVRDLKVTLPGGTAAQLNNAFTIGTGGGPDLWLDIEGRQSIRPNDNSHIYVVVGNRGSVDAVGVPLVIEGIPNGWHVELGFEVDPPPHVEGETEIDWSSLPVVLPTEGSSGQVAALFIPVVPAKSSITLDLIVNPRGHGDPAHIEAWVSPPFFMSPLNPEVVPCLLGIGTYIAGVVLPENCVVKAAAFAQTVYSTVRNLGYQHSTQPTGGTVVYSTTALTVDVLEVALSCAGAAYPPLQLALGFASQIDQWHDIIQDCSSIFNQLIHTAVDISISYPRDPNELFGPKGIGSVNFISGAQPLEYATYFENEPGASGPAQQVIVTNPLDPGVNLSTLTLASISVPQFQIPINQSFNPLVGHDQFATTVDLRPGMDLLLNVSAILNRPNRLVTWTFTSIDPATGLPPEDPGVGFLAPGEEGSVVFGVKQNPQLPTGTVLSDQATVVFDTQPPMSTSTWMNTVDNTAPASQVSTLPGTELCVNFNVQWSGNDIGAGIQDYTIYASDNGGAFTAWQTNTTSTSAVFNGQVGHTYGFYSIARDLVGNVEPGKTSAEATTRVNKGTICGPIGPPTPLGGRR